MTRKDYEVIAELLRETKKLYFWSEITDIIELFAQRLEHEAKLKGKPFNREKFITTCKAAKEPK